MAVRKPLILDNGVLKELPSVDSLNSPGARAPYETDIGDGSATSFTITHSFGTRAVQVKVYANASPYAEVIPDKQYTSTSVVTLIFGAAYTPTSNQYHVEVWG